MASLRIFVPFHMRPRIEPPEHIMRAQVAAQAWDCPRLLLKSRSGPPVTIQDIEPFEDSMFRSVRERARRRGFDQASTGLPHRPWNPRSAARSLRTANRPPADLRQRRLSRGVFPAPTTRRSRPPRRLRFSRRPSCRLAVGRSASRPPCSTRSTRLHPPRRLLASLRRYSRSRPQACPAADREALPRPPPQQRNPVPAAPRYASPLSAPGRAQAAGTQGAPLNPSELS